MMQAIEEGAIHGRLDSTLFGSVQNAAVLPTNCDTTIGGKALTRRNSQRVLRSVQLILLCKFFVMASCWLTDKSLSEYLNRPALKVRANGRKSSQEDYEGLTTR
ncbi:MAG: hypothetical protein KME27_21780 [Lyngbya sp. HA4199-MV5]|nr:hypothetical protein [Lyngbya sp. HA4199-MV5]